MANIIGCYLIRIGIQIKDTTAADILVFTNGFSRDILNYLAYLSL